MNQPSGPWVEWQREHAAALAALQEAQRAYHRSIAGSAFAGPTEATWAVEIRKEALDALEGTRVRLDGVRARQPGVA